MTGTHRHHAPALGATVRQVHAVTDFSFELPAGATLGIVGESGCGKSTAARLLMHLTTPDSGQIRLNGAPVDRDNARTLKDFRRQVQMVFQDSAASLNPRLTIEQSIIFGPVVHGVDAGEARANARMLLDRVGLDPAGYAGRYPHELSGGQRQRVNIARALALRPKVVIFDEAVSALDKSVEAQVLNLLGELKSEFGLSYIFISHDLNVMRYISDHVLVMYLGQVVEQGPVQKIFDAPRHPYTQALLASMPTTDPEHRTQAPPITGDPPNPIGLPPGCRFAPRCGFAEALCVRMPAELRHGAARVRCHMADPKSGHSHVEATA
jgi:peptide/nickel transport system ATP-binding protein